uniref:Uncharacterized protein n=1 Tax=Thermocrinis ruber TaxID=75906 RepID=A0A7C5X4Q7_9AQUI
MGQYYVAANISKREFLDPHRLGSGSKLVEMFYSEWFSRALLAALALGDWTLPDHPFVGRWAGGQVILVGDYMTSDYVSRLISEGRLSLPSWVLEELDKDDDALDGIPSFYSFVKKNFKDVSVEAIKFLYRVCPEEGLTLAMRFVADYKMGFVDPKSVLELLKDKDIAKALQQEMGGELKKILSRIKRSHR